MSAYAKVNLSLEILGRRPDGFHEIVSVTQVISLADGLVAGPAERFSIEMEPPLVGHEENLAGQAARALAAETGRTLAARLQIQKQIPLAAGLGGGSSDAAATLRLLDRLWNTQVAPHRLATIAASLGSDVTLFLGGGTSLIRGRGEIVQALRRPPAYWLVLICPGGAPADKTRALYSSLTPADYGSGSSTLMLAEGLALGRSIVGATLVNSFDVAADRVYPGFAELRRRLAELVGRPVYLTGAGPSLFATFAGRGEARQAARRASALGHRTFVARSVSRIPAIRAFREPAPAAGRVLE